MMTKEQFLDTVKRYEESRRGVDRVKYLNELSTTCYEIVQRLIKIHDRIALKPLFNTSEFSDRPQYCEMKDDNMVLCMIQSKVCWAVYVDFVEFNVDMLDGEEKFKDYEQKLIVKTKKELVEKIEQLEEEKTKAVNRFDALTEMEHSPQTLKSLTSIGDCLAALKDSTK